MSAMIDVIIPVYNQEKYLKRCLDSFLSQNTEIIHLIVVDDGSTDDSLEMCKDYENRYPGIISVVHKENGGLSSARNAGLDVSRAEYVTFVDPDDYVENEYIDTIRSFIDGFDHASALFAFAYQIKHTDFGTSEVLLENKMLDCKSAISYLMSNGAFNICWNKVYKKSVLQENNLRFILNSEPGEDLLFNCRYFKYIDTVVISDKILYDYMRNGEDSGANKFRADLWEKGKSFIQEIEDLFLFFGLASPMEQNVLSKACVEYIHSNITNMYRGDHTFSKQQRINFYSEILSNKKYNYYFSMLICDSKLLSKLKSLYLKGSPTKMDRYYCFAMFIRNRFAFLYNFLRKTLIKS